jgi:hypothetical protein
VRPGADAGLGDGLALISLNGDVVYLLKERSAKWTPFVGGGPAFVVQAFREGQGDSGVGPGFNLIGGVREQKGLLIEVRIGAFDSARFRVGLGWTW